MKRFEIEYRDCTGMKCMVDDILSASEKEAVIKLQLELINDNDLMTELIYVEELVQESNDGEWSMKDGTVLDQDSQDALNEAFNTFVNEDGLTLKETFDKELEENK
tara:strand:+ start:134 stop:451 length:318 start_codon:yes stop_codon:yes gene_type:complete